MKTMVLNMSACCNKTISSFVKDWGTIADGITFGGKTKLGGYMVRAIINEEEMTRIKRMIDNASFLMSIGQREAACGVLDYAAKIVGQPTE